MVELRNEDRQRVMTVRVSMENDRVEPQPSAREELPLAPWSA
jgi:hypothetical protein